MKSSWLEVLGRVALIIVALASVWSNQVPFKVVGTIILAVQAIVILIDRIFYIKYHTPIAR
jgi:hypothetical protein